MAVTEYQCIFYQKTRRHIPEDIYHADIHLCHHENSFFRYKTATFIVTSRYLEEMLCLYAQRATSPKGTKSEALFSDLYSTFLRPAGI